MMDASKLHRFQTDPKAFRAELRIPTASGPAKLGDVQSDFQRRDFEALDETLLQIAGIASRGPFVHRSWIERCKGGSKDTDAAVAALYLLLFSRRKLHLQIGACDRDQAGLVKQAATDIIKLNPWIERVLTTKTWEIENPHTGAFLEILAHDVGGSHGGRPDALWINELAHFPPDGAFAQVLLSNAHKNPNCFVGVLTNAGFTNSFAHTLRQEAETSPRWHFSVTKELSPWMSDADVAEARRVLPRLMFRRLYEGIWSDGSGEGIEPDHITRSIRQIAKHPNPEYRYVLAVDAGLKKDRSAVVVLAKHVGLFRRVVTPAPSLPLRHPMAALVDAGVLPAAQPIARTEHIPATGKLEVADWRIWAPTNENQVSLANVETFIRLANRTFGLDAVACDPWQLEYLCERLRKSGIKVLSIAQTGKSLNAQCSALSSALEERLLSIPPRADELVQDLKEVSIQERGYGVRFVSPRNARGHGDLCSALSIAAAVARNIKTRRRDPNRPIVLNNDARLLAYEHSH